jgi:hypothetical protein
MEKKLGRIASISFGWGGYQDAMIGLSVSLEGNGWGVGDFKGAWGIERTDYCEWSEDDRVRQLGEAAIFLRDLLIKAKKQTISELKGTPVEVEFDGMALKSWRILEEVL